MEVKTAEEVVGTVHTSPPLRMSREEKLLRWADVLEKRGMDLLTPIQRIEFLSPHDRVGLRSDNSPLALAAADPVLREEGLTSDRFGDGVNFFELAIGEAHYLLCDCHYQGTMAAERVAGRVRTVASHC